MRPSERDRLNHIPVTHMVTNDDRDHFITCPSCGMVTNYRKLGDVLGHEDRCQRARAANDNA